MKKRLVALLLLSALLLALCATAAAEQEEPLPDIDITSWEFKLANSYNSISWYLPEYGSIEGQGLDPRVVPAAKELLAAARADGLECYMAMAFRNTDWIFNHFYWRMAEHDYDPIATAKDLLPPGANEHQTGLCIDFTDNRKNQCIYDDFEDPEIFDTALYAWLLEHAPEYGFVLRYPAGKEDLYGTPCRHAHFRYVGVEAAKYMTEHDLCLEEFLMLYDPDAVFIPEHGKLN
jgi:D-alanyl-D-alanine carboxypeptidase